VTAAAQLASTHAGVLYLIEMQFAAATIRLTNWNHNLDWAGNTWLGLGAVVSVGSMSESEALQYPSLDIGLNPGNPSMLALALGQASTYRGRPITVWYGVLNNQLMVQDVPQPFWAGVMDSVRLVTGDGEQEQASVVMRCECPGKDKRAAQYLRLNHAQHSARWPGDTGLSRIERLVGQPQTWLSKKFQQQ
jgi:hypothetical protein